MSRSEAAVVAVAGCAAALVSYWATGAILARQRPSRAWDALGAAIRDGALARLDSSDLATLAGWPHHG